MQKTNIKASILIWATFLSLIISVTFISISTKINKNLKNNSELINSFKINNEIKNIINSGSINSTFFSQNLSNGDQIVFDSSDLYEFSLKKGKTHIIKINENSDITINILEGGPINTSSGLVTSTNTFSLNIGDFKIINLGGYTKLNITSNSTKNFLSKYTNYKILKQIGNKEIVKSKGNIKNF